MKVQYLLTFPQIRAINLLIHIDGTILPEDVNDKRLVEYDIPTAQKFMLDSLLSQEGFVVKDETQWPSDGDEYYYINDEGDIMGEVWNLVFSPPSYVDTYRRDIGNVFKTIEEAEFVRERLKVLNQLKSLSDDQEWNNENPHYCIVYDSDCDKFDMWKNYSIKLPNVYYFKSEESVNAAIEAIGEDKLKKYIFNIKE